MYYVHCAPCCIQPHQRFTEAGKNTQLL